MSESNAAAPALPEVVQNVVSPATPAIGRVVSSELVTRAGKKSASFVRHVAIDIGGTPLEGAFRAGQSFGVVPPGEDARGKAHKLRLYSIASPTAGEDGKGCVLATTVKRLIDEHDDDHSLLLGVASNYLCDLQPGDEVRVTGPSGKRFLLPERPLDHRYVFFATGTGVAPFRGMIGDIEVAVDASAPGSVPSGAIAALVMGVPYQTDLLYDRHFRDLDAEHAWFRYLPAISRERQDDGAGRLYVQDRIDNDPASGSSDALVEMLADPRSLVYVCGIAGMELGIIRKMAEHLPSDVLAQYIQIDDEVADSPDQWTRRMLNRQIKVTKRMMLEVY
ncbi:MAG: hypothetical protein AAF235_05240 [Planctomycetota bacterium]